jgi:hypothetical protein
MRIHNETSASISFNIRVSPEFVKLLNRVAAKKTLETGDLFKASTLAREALYKLFGFEGEEE